MQKAFLLTIFCVHLLKPGIVSVAESPSLLEVSTHF